MQYEPIGKRIIIDPEKITETENGIQRADQGQSMPVKGTVIAVGKDSQFKLGEVLLFRRYSVDELSMPSTDGSVQNVYLCDDEDIVARSIVNTEVFKTPSIKKKMFWFF